MRAIQAHACFKKGDKLWLTRNDLAAPDSLPNLAIIRESPPSMAYLVKPVAKYYLKHKTKKIKGEQINVRKKDPTLDKLYVKLSKRKNKKPA